MSTIVSATGAAYQYEVSPSQRTALLPADSAESCAAGCKGFPTLAYLSCTASCARGIDLAAGERNPSVLPNLPGIPDLGAIAGNVAGAIGGAAKWLIVGLVAFAVIRVAGVLK